MVAGSKRHRAPKRFPQQCGGAGGPPAPLDSTTRGRWYHPNLLRDLPPQFLLLWSPTPQGDQEASCGVRASVGPHGLSQGAPTSTQQSPRLRSLRGNTPCGSVLLPGPCRPSLRISDSDVVDCGEPQGNVQEVRGMIRILFLGSDGFRQGQADRACTEWLKRAGPTGPLWKGRPQSRRPGPVPARSGPWRHGGSPLIKL